jgi:signal transduction histidine kinase
MESGNFKLVHSPFAFHSVIQCSAMAYARAAKSKGIKLETDLDSRVDTDLGSMVVGDEMRLNQITS